MTTFVRDGWYPNGGGGADPLTGSFDATGCDYLRFWVFANNTAVTSITYGGQSPTLISGATATFPGDPSPSLSVYQLVAPTTGTNTCTVDLASAPGRHSLYIIGRTGVHQVTPSGTAVASVVEGATPLTISATSTSGQLVEAGILASGSVATFDTTGGGVERENQLDFNSIGRSFSVAERTTVSPTFTWTPGVAQDAFMIAIPVLPAAGSSGAPRFQGFQMMMRNN